MWWVFPHLISYRKPVFVSVGLAYTVIFLLMCWRVKEGEYPPPTATAHPSVLKSFLRYFRDCLSIPMYRDFFIVWVLVAVGMNCAGAFGTLFVWKTLGISMEDLGHVSAWLTLANMVAYLPMGWLCDKFHPLRIAISGLVVYVLFWAAAYWLVQDRTTWLVFSILGMLPGTMWGLGSYVLSMEIFPSEKFGQFSAGLNVFGCGALIIGNYLIGAFMDWNGNNYRLVYVWNIVFCVLAIAAMIPVYRGWRKHGGPDQYVPPLQ